MADAIIARQQGDDFQARWFWLYAANLLRDSSHIQRVSFETGPKAFDDVVVEYAAENAPLDHQGHPYLRDHMQCKWHVRPGQFSHQDLTDPKFSNAQSVSLLQRALDAQRQYAPDGRGARFHLVTNWDPIDPLRGLILNQTNALDLGRLFEGRSRSKMGKIRAHWTNHLQVGENELQLAMRTLCLNVRVRSAEDIRAHLNDLFETVGLRRIPASESAFIYDDLIRKLHGQGRKAFDRRTFREMVRDEKLLEGDAPPSRTIVGVRSFMHPINPIEARTARNLDLVPMFAGRYLEENQDWNGTVYPALQRFLLTEARETDDLRLVLDAHVSLAYATGSILDVKSGKNVEIEQRSNGRRFWSESDVDLHPSWPNLAFVEERLGDGKDLAIAVAITHDIERNVRDHVAAHVPDVGKLLIVRPETSASQGAVRCGSHAAHLAENVAGQVRALGRVPMVHMFIAAPNGMTFFLGRHHRTIGPTTVYEWDFEGLRDGGYSPGLTIS